jgi:hypothetical protein
MPDCDHNEKPHRDFNESTTSKVAHEIGNRNSRMLCGKQLLKEFACAYRRAAREEAAAKYGVLLESYWETYPSALSYGGIHCSFHSSHCLTSSGLVERNELLKSDLVTSNMPRLPLVNFSDVHCVFRAMELCSLEFHCVHSLYTY